MTEWTPQNMGDYLSEIDMLVRRIVDLEKERGKIYAESKKAAQKDGKCKYLSDDFNEICVNAESPACADVCPCVNYPQICKYAEIVK